MTQYRGYKRRVFLPNRHFDFILRLEWNSCAASARLILSLQKLCRTKLWFSEASNTLFFRIERGSIRQSPDAKKKQGNFPFNYHRGSNVGQSTINFISFFSASRFIFELIPIQTPTPRDRLGRPWLLLSLGYRFL